MVLLSMLLARTIAEPVRRLADAAENVRRRIRSRGEIPDFTYRRDEIGELSGALREMTNSLYSRIEAIESFAADVAHELKNPLTSLRSAVETMPLAKTPESRARLLAVIQHDVKRLDRLISDVSDASRLDAELQRQDTAPVDLTRLLKTVVTVANEVRRDDGVKITLAFEGGPPRSFGVRGHDSRLGQVIDNLIENARSFSVRGGTVRITAKRLRNAVEITVDDDGPGIQPEAIERIFERFYTDRPHQGLARTPASGFPSRARSSRRMAAASAPKTASACRRSRTVRRCSARASWCACLRCDVGDWAGELRSGYDRGRNMNLDLYPIGWVHFVASLIALAAGAVVLDAAEGHAGAPAARPRLCRDARHHQRYGAFHLSQRECSFLRIGSASRR
jgi:two-component system sensor histidine kinase ChvG